MNIEIITTNNEALKETGFGTIKSCQSVLASINKMGHSVTLNVCQTLQDLNDVVKRKPDLVVLAVKYIVLKDEENIWLSEFFANNGVNYSGSTRGTLMFDSDKVLAKSYLKEKGINTANYFTATPGQYKRDSDLPIRYPLFLKPLNAANGNGIDDLSFVNNFSEFESKVLSLHELFHLPVLVEEYLDGQEFQSIETAKNTLKIYRSIDGYSLIRENQVLAFISNILFQLKDYSHGLEYHKQIKVMDEYVHFCAYLQSTAHLFSYTKPIKEANAKNDAFENCILERYPENILLKATLSVFKTQTNINSKNFQKAATSIMEATNYWTINPSETPLLKELWLQQKALLISQGIDI